MSGRTLRTNAMQTFIVDQCSVDRLDGRQIDWTHVGEDKRETPGTLPVSVVVGVAGAAQSATSIPVAALSGAIPSGTDLDFGGAKFARTTAAAAAAATAITVAALPTALVSTDTATYPGVVGSGNKVLRAGTVVGDTLGSGKISPRVASTNPAIGLLASDAVENDPIRSKSGYGVIVGAVVYENMLPDAVSGSIASGIKTELNAAGASKGFLFQTYGDDRS